MSFNGPHQNQPVLASGVPLENAEAAMILVHGRGASAADILTLSDEFSAGGFAFLAPQASGGTWYPTSFLSPIPVNEPGISSGIAAIGSLVDRITAAGIPADRIILLGFSQGACLALEFAARHARRYGGVAALSGGLIGPDDAPRDYPGSMEGTPVFLGCSDIDFHIPKERVLHSADVFRQLGAEVTSKLYPNMGHTVNLDEINFVNSLMAQTRQTLP